MDPAAPIKSSPKIFISHRHSDKPIADKLVKLLDKAFIVEDGDIMCTSLVGYGLSPGEPVSATLRSYILLVKLVIGILSPETSESNYVLAELGAAWGKGVEIFPLRARGAKPEDVRGR
jgi:hypothetical protein